jgi:hypothetical protein
MKLFRILPNRATSHTEEVYLSWELLLLEKLSNKIAASSTRPQSLPEGLTEMELRSQQPVDNTFLPVVLLRLNELPSGKLLTFSEYT